jgi:hypothetical protein
MESGDERSNMSSGILEEQHFLDSLVADLPEESLHRRILRNACR